MLDGISSELIIVANGYASKYAGDFPVVKVYYVVVKNGLACASTVFHDYDELTATFRSADEALRYEFVYNLLAAAKADPSAFVEMLEELLAQFRASSIS